MTMQSLTTLSTTDILDKEFRTELRGYSTTEVDDFLDEVIADYTKLYNEIKRLTEENKALSKQYQSKTLTEDGTASASTTNYDILKRVSLLEKQVVEIMNHLRRKAEQEKLQQTAATQKVTTDTGVTPEIK